jgi:hypothetical protein
MTMIEQIQEAEAELSLMRATGNRRKVAEVFYVLAHLHRDAGNAERVGQYARESFTLFEQLGINTLEEAAHRYFSLAGVQLPGLIHEGVVYNTFAMYLL